MGRRAVASFALLAVTVVAWAGLRASAAYDPITDLPFDGTYPLTCGWHSDCNPVPGYNADAGGIDIGTPSGTLVRAAGHGTVDSSGYHSAYGNFVRIGHGSEQSLYAHLTWFFLRPNTRVCRHAPVGYSGNSGNALGPHLHFEGARAPDQFPPIHGDRPDTYDVDDFTYDPYAVPRQPRPNITHLGSRTRAYVVDDRSNFEFFLHPKSGLWRDAPYGYGHAGEKAARMYYLPLGPAYSPTVMATWDPVLRNPGVWDVYVFIPYRHATARQAHYQVRWLDGSGWQKTDMYVDQHAASNEWVRLENATHRSFPTQRSGQWQLSVRLYGDCSGGDCSSDAEIGADAAMFVPADCGP